MINLINLTRIVGGVLKSEPKVSMVESFAILPTSLKPKGAFIAINATQQDIKIAVENGAHAIIYDSEIEICENEIAFIKVSNLNVAITRLIGYFCDLSQHRFVQVNALQRDILSLISTPKNIVKTSKNLAEFFMILLNSNENLIFFNDDFNLYKKLNLIIEILEDNYDFEVLYAGSIFYSNFIFMNEHYADIIFPRLFLPSLCGVLKFLKSANVNFKISDFKALSHFQPTFIDKFFKICSFGASYRAIIVEKNKELFVNEAKFLRENFKNGIKICANWNDNIENVELDFKFSNLTAIKNLGEFHYALILCENDDLLNVLQIEENERNLFDL